MNKKKKLVLIPIVIGITFLTIIFLSNQFRSTQAQDVQIPTIKVIQGTIRETIEAEGSLAPFETVNVKSKEDGYKVETVLIEEGDSVTKGQELVKLDVSEYEANLKRAETELITAQTTLKKLLEGATELEITQAETALEQAQLNYQNAQVLFERNQKLYKSGAISQQELNDSQNQMEIYKQTFISAQKKLDDLLDGADEDEIEVARAQLAQAEANIIDAQKKIEYGTITSPIDGVAIEVSVEKEDVVTQAETLITIGNLEQMKALVAFNEIDVPKIKVGAESEITLDAFPDEVIKGKVTFISLKSQIIDNIVTYEGEIIIPNSERRLLPGMTVDATVIIDQSENTLLLPLEVLVEEGDKTFVLVPGPQKEPERIPIKVGLRNDEFFEILAGLGKDKEVMIPSINIKSTQSNQGPLGMGGPPPGM
ncbi:MAG: efflux RND transporter periplasmic adaptor subunit [Candidatus Atribacteria bacterium]|nr:efflux RND transporter periplasmic adaptor subunit [Candidatus Atribacteria bacterium]